MVSPERDFGTVAIGGINHENVQRIIYQSQSPARGLDGVAIVSAIMAADDPKSAAKEFASRITILPPFAVEPPEIRESEVSALLDEVPKIVRKMVSTHPLVHNMINYVVANFVANVALALYDFLCMTLEIQSTDSGTGALLRSCPLMATRRRTLLLTMVD